MKLKTSKPQSNLTISNIDGFFRKGELGTLDSVSWDFHHLSIIEARPKNKDADTKQRAGR